MSSPQPTLTLRTAAGDGVHVVTLAGELDIAGASAVLDKLTRMIDEGATRLIIDLTGVTYLDTSGLTVLVHAQSRARRNGGVLVVVAGDGHVRQLMEIAGLNRAFSVAADLDEARRTLRASG